MPCFGLGLDAQAAGQRWFGAVRTEVEEQEGGWSLTASPPPSPNTLQVNKWKPKSFMCPGMQALPGSTGLTQDARPCSLHSATT